MSKPSQGRGPLSDALMVAGLEFAPEAVLVAGAEARILYANAAARTLLGRDRDTLLTLSIPAILPACPWDTGENGETGEPTTLETTLLGRDGVPIPCEVTRVRVDGAPEEGEFRFLYVRDLTVRRQVEESLRKSESRYALAFNASPDAINLTRIDDGTYIEVSTGFERLTGWRRDEVLGRTSLELGLWADPAQRARVIGILREKGEYDGEPCDFRHRNGRIIKGLMSGRRVTLDGVPGLLTITRDVTAQVDAQQALANLNDLITAITAHVPAYILLLDREHRIQFINRLAPGFKLAEVVGMDFLDGITPEVKPLASLAAERILAGSEREIYEGWGWGPDRQWRWYRSIMGPMTERGEVVGIILIAMDETDRRVQEESMAAMEDALRQAQKLESLGVLAGGIAHDFNNLLTAVMGNLNLAQIKLPETSPAIPHLEAVENTVLKASELTRQMLAYSGKGRFSVKPQDLNVLVAEMVHLLEVSVNKGADLRIDLGEGLAAVEGDAAQIQQVIMNLVTNASEALADREGFIRVSTGAQVLGAGDLAAFPAQDLKEGAFVVLEVEDTGCGMSPEIQARIFDPFFTTKVKGRGLGLSAMLGILKGHRAGLRITSRQGEGSSFRVFFPASPNPLPLRPETVPEGAAPFQGRVLLVDDETVILDSIALALENMGFTVTKARDGLEALESFEASAPVLVLMDLTMPRMDGATAFGRMAALRPDIPVILSSGYDRQALEGLAPAGFVQKPYRIKELRQLLTDVLARQA